MPKFPCLLEIFFFFVLQRKLFEILMILKSSELSDAGRGSHFRDVTLNVIFLAHKYTENDFRPTNNREDPHRFQTRSRIGRGEQ